MAIARWQISTVWSAPMRSRADTTNDADSALSFKKYCEKPPSTVRGPCNFSQYVEMHSCPSLEWTSTSNFQRLLAQIKEDTVKKLMIVALMVGASMSWGTRTNAQTTPTQESTPHVISNQDLDLLRKDLRQFGC